MIIKIQSPSKIVHYGIVWPLAILTMLVTALAVISVILAIVHAL